ncbi:hypothetical protein PARHAE_03251 [Paracoccus haematequi]|uniref:Uncharacterized protein n=1 Tax=Paracoccus haematequi TaxID=2491866 RepID=A0A3S4CL50_9RHOB|nr:hypothetical protein [Paracoccus haematequi]VDS10040.1 hypothetical protein PARHAE_03251 [Paracoccus haematequi]
MTEILAAIADRAIRAYGYEAVMKMSPRQAYAVTVSSNQLREADLAHGAIAARAGMGGTKEEFGAFIGRQMRRANGIETEG